MLRDGRPEFLAGRFGDLPPRARVRVQQKMLERDVEIGEVYLVVVSCVGCLADPCRTGRAARAGPGRDLGGQAPQDVCARARPAAGLHLRHVRPRAVRALHPRRAPARPRRPPARVPELPAQHAPAPPRAPALGQGALARAQDDAALRRRRRRDAARAGVGVGRLALGRGAPRARHERLRGRARDVLPHVQRLQRGVLGAHRAQPQHRAQLPVLRVRVAHGDVRELQGS